MRGARAENLSTGRRNKYFSSGSAAQHITIFNLTTHEPIRKEHLHSTTAPQLHIFSKHQNHKKTTTHQQTWATAQRQPPSVTAKRRLALLLNLSSNPYVFFFPFCSGNARLLSEREEKNHSKDVSSSVCTVTKLIYHANRTSPPRASSARSASRTSSRRPSARRWRSTPATSTARSTRIASLLLPNQWSLLSFLSFIRG